MKNTAIFVDTGAWFAIADESDQYHKRSIEMYPVLFKENYHLTTTNLVISGT